MDTFFKKLKKSEKVDLGGVAIITSGAVEVLFDGKRLSVKTIGKKIGYELLFAPEMDFKLRALEDDTTITVIPLETLRELYNENLDVKKMADGVVKTVIEDFYQLLISRDHFSLAQVLERLVDSSNNHYCILNVSELCEELGYSRQQFYRAVKELEKRGIIYDKKTKCFRREL